MFGDLLELECVDGARGLEVPYCTEFRPRSEVTEYTDPGRGIDVLLIWETGVRWRFTGPDFSDRSGDETAREFCSFTTKVAVFGVNGWWWYWSCGTI